MGPVGRLWRILAAVAAGDLTPSEAADVGKLVVGYVKAIEIHEVLARLDKLEKHAMRRVIELRLKKLEAASAPEERRRVHIVASTETATANEVMAEMIEQGRAFPHDMFILLVPPKPVGCSAKAVRSTFACE